MNDNDLTPLGALLSHRQEPDKDLNDLARAVVGAGIEVHRHLGPGLGEFFYETALYTANCRQPRAMKLL